jgi:hypothetical protein
MPTQVVGSSARGVIAGSLRGLLAGSRRAGVAAHFSRGFRRAECLQVPVAGDRGFKRPWADLLACSVADTIIGQTSLPAYSVAQVANQAIHTKRPVAQLRMENQSRSLGDRRTFAGTEERTVGTRVLCAVCWRVHGAGDVMPTQVVGSSARGVIAGSLRGLFSGSRRAGVATHFSRGF